MVFACNVRPADPARNTSTASIEYSETNRIHARCTWWCVGHSSHRQKKIYCFSMLQAEKTRFVVLLYHIDRRAFVYCCSMTQAGRIRCAAVLLYDPDRRALCMAVMLLCDIGKRATAVV